MARMKRVILLMACFVALGAFVQAQDVTPAMEADFLIKVKAAVGQKDFAAFSALHCQKGTVDPAMKDQLDKFSRGLFDTIAGMSSPDYEFVQPPAKMLTSFSHEGKNYEPNLKIVGLLQVHDPNGKPNTAAGGTWSFPLGVDNGALMIVQTVLKK
jgi:hypothetical protein